MRRRSASPHPWATLWALATVQLLLVLDASIVAAALPVIERELRLDGAAASWIVNAYGLCFGGLLLLGGRLSDLLDPRRLVWGGLTLLVAASAAAGLAPNFGWLVVARAGQGIAAAAASPAALTLVLRVFTGGRPRDQALGVWSAMGVCGVGVGYLVGGPLVSWFGWRATLFVNLPVAAVALGVLPLLVRGVPAGAPARDLRTRGRGFDVTGAVTVTSGLGLLAYVMANASQAGWGSAQTVGLLALDLLILTLFVLTEHRAAHPLVPLRVFRRRALVSADAGLVLLAAAMMPAFYFFAADTQQVMGYGPARAGVAQLPMIVMLALASAAAPGLVARFGAKKAVIAGLLLLGGSLLWFSAAPERAGYGGRLLGPSLLFGAAAVAWVGLTICATRRARPGEFGVVGGLMGTTGQVGAALGLSLLLPLALSRTQDLQALGVAGPAALSSGYRLAFLVAAGLTLLALAEVAVALPGGRWEDSGTGAERSGAPVVEGAVHPRLVTPADPVPARVEYRVRRHGEAGATQGRMDTVGYRGAGEVDGLQVEQST
jgi:MFS family permease